MAFNIWMWILLVLFIVGTIAVILILTVGSVLEERSYDRRSEDEIEVDMAFWRQRAALKYVHLMTDEGKIYLRQPEADDDDLAAEPLH